VIRRIAFLALLSCVASPCLTADQAAGQSPRIEPLTRGRAAGVMAGIDGIADETERRIMTPGSSRGEPVFDDIRGVMTHASEWRWYYRDHGVLVAIPVRERLGIATRTNAENLVADVVRGIISEQGLGSPPVQAVFIEPEIPCPSLHRRIDTLLDGGSAGQGFGGCGCR